MVLLIIREFECSSMLSSRHQPPSQTMRYLPRNVRAATQQQSDAFGHSQFGRGVVAASKQIQWRFPALHASVHVGTLIKQRLDRREKFRERPTRLIV
jgi:hypothetical protein